MPGSAPLKECAVRENPLKRPANLISPAGTAGSALPNTHSAFSLFPKFQAVEDCTSTDPSLAVGTSAPAATHLTIKAVCLQ